MSKIGGWEPTGFGGRLLELRQAAGLTQQELADKAGCHWMTITKLERGVQEPAWPLVLALAAALGTTCDTFVNGRAAPRPRGRTPKVKTEEPAPLRRRGRPRKQQTHEQEKLQQPRRTEK